MGFRVRQRYVLILTTFIGFMIAFAERSALTMAMTRMVEIPNLNVTSSTVEPICEAAGRAVDKITGEVVTDQAQNGVKYNSTQEQQGLIFSCFSVGYIVTHVPGGLLAQNFGGKYVLGLAITISALCSMAIPLAVQYGGFFAIIALRILMGAFQGPIFPALFQMLSVWVPPTERTFLTSIVYAGTNIGTVIASYFAGIILHYYSWEMVFYFFGLLAIVWFVIFCFICYDSPSRHPFISTAEQSYLLKELGKLKRDENQSATPWRDIFNSKPVWALIITNMCSDWAYYVASATLPKYMNDVLHLSIRDIGTFNSFPWILKTITAFGFGFIIDSFCVTVVFFIIAIGMHGPGTSGPTVNLMDLSPNYSGILMSVSNGMASIAGILAPYTIGVMTPNAYLSEWRPVFWVTFAIHILKITIFIIWSSGQIQPWNENKNTNTTHSEKVTSIKQIPEDDK